LESDFSAYKVRAHALLQKKDAELNAAKNSDLIKANEEAMRVCHPFIWISDVVKDLNWHDWLWTPLIRKQKRRLLLLLQNEIKQPMTFKMHSQDMVKRLRLGTVA
jgi:hypothetical protein